jgi:hypothetical protein
MNRIRGDFVGHWELSGMYILRGERKRLGASWCSLFPRTVRVKMCFLLCVPQVCLRPSVLYFVLCVSYLILCVFLRIAFCLVLSLSYLCIWNRMVSGQKFVLEVPSQTKVE